MSEIEHAKPLQAVNGRLKCDEESCTNEILAQAACRSLELITVDSEREHSKTHRSLVAFGDQPSIDFAGVVIGCFRLSEFRL